MSGEVAVFLSKPKPELLNQYLQKVMEAVIKMLFLARLYHKLSKMQLEMPSLTRTLARKKILKRVIQNRQQMNSRDLRHTKIS